MATHSSTLAWKIPWMEEPDGLQSMGSHRVIQDWSDLAAAAAGKAMVFPVVMYECESWTIKKTERRRIDAFKLWCWRRFLRVPWTARSSNQSILKEFSSEYSLQALTLKLHYFVHLIWRVDSLERPWCWKRLRAGGEGGNRGWDGWMASLTRWTWVWASSGG